MKGFLSFLILWLLHKKPMTGSELAEEIGKRRGAKPTPGTIYPALAQLVKRGALNLKTEGRSKRYFITASGKKALEAGVQLFCKAFYDVFSR